MLDIKVTLYTNKRFLLTILNKHKIIAGENITTTVRVQFPEEYEKFSKRVDFLNEKGEKWTEALYTPEYQEYEIDFNRSIFNFTIPDNITFPGEFYMQFIAYDPKNHTITPFDTIVLAVEKGILYCKKRAEGNPDLIVKSYEHSVWAVDTVLKNLKKTEEAIATAEQVTQEAKDTAEEAQTRAENAEKSAHKAAKHAKAAQTAAESAKQKSEETVIALSEEIERTTQVEADLQTAIETETTRATTAEEEIASNLIAETERATAAEEEIVKGMEKGFEELKESFGETNQELKEVLQAEETARIQGDEQLQANITAENERATAAEQVNAQAIEIERERAGTAEDNLQTAIMAEETRARDAEEIIVSKLSAETERAVTAEQENVQSIEDEWKRATTAEDDLQTAITAEKTRAINVESVLDSKIDAETDRAKVAEQTNTQAIVAEKNRAETAEDNLQAANTAETARATNAENAITANLDTEIQRARTAEQTNAQATVAERDRAQTAEGDLQKAITNETNRALTAENTLSAAITTETNRATLAEAGLGAAIASETLRATTAEALLSSAIQTETVRAMQAEADLRTSLATAHKDAVSEANAYTDELVEQVRLDGTVYRGTVGESELPEEKMENGDLYWISDFDISQPGHSGSAIWNGKTEEWDFNIDRYKHQDDDTIVARDSDGALKVADIEEDELTADTADYGTSVNTGFKATMRGIIRKIKGLFQRTTENATAISDETTRATTAEGQLAADIMIEETRAKAAEQANANSIAVEVTRATEAEQAISQALTDEIQRATQAEQQNANAIADEMQRTTAVESDLATALANEETARIAGNNTNANTISAEVTRATTAEGQIANDLATEIARATSAEHATAMEIEAEKTRATQAEADLETNKVDKVAGKGLSTEDYTTAEKNKLASLEKNHAKPTTEYGVASKVNYGHVKFYGNANNDSEESLVNPTWEHFYNSAFNCNDYRTPGRVYQNHDRSGAGATQNGPLGNTTDRCCLEIYTIPSDTATVLQHYISIINGREFIRNFRNGEWSNWKEIAFIDSLIVKVDKVDGKELSTEDFTTAEKQKLADIDGDNYLQKTGGAMTGNLTLKYPNKIIGSGNGQVDADWLRYDNGSNLLHIGNTGTVPAINAAGSCFYRRNSAGTNFKVFDEGNPAVVEQAVQFASINTSISNPTGYYLKETATRGRLFVRFSVTASITNWQNLFNITGTDIPTNIGNSLGFGTTMSGSSFNGTALNSFCVRGTNGNIGVMAGGTLNAGWDYTAIFFI